MTDASDIALGTVAGAVVTAAARAAEEPPTTALIVGGGCGLFLALIPRSRPAGLALLAASVVGAAVVSGTASRRRA